MPAERRPLRVLHCPTDVGGHPCELSRGERAIGLDSIVAVTWRGPFDYPVDIDLGLEGASRFRRLIGRVQLFAHAFGRYDVIHFNFGQRFLPTVGPLCLDLPLLRAAGARIFTTFQGCDARLPTNCPVCCHGNGRCALTLARTRLRAARASARWSDRTFVLNPDLLDTVPKAVFLPYARLDPRTVPPVFPAPHSGALRVAHAPTNRLVKGTEAALDAARQLGGLVELDLIEGVSNEQTLHRLAAADVVVDQLRLGWYGGLAAESMALGKPVIAYIDPRGRERIPRAMAEEMPIISTDSCSLLATIERLATSERATLPDRGRASRRFVERWHDPMAIARWMARVYADPKAADAGFVPEG
ncbi:MAG: glycosyltransferase family 1 protein [Leptolyngbya sp. PLA3]|nr:MAG: glycosyltransferase family 1 protein [Cyanobacteria bacterium CYA]MCE7969918.1 glycosyltransferase family 1 protein [Leptolyngbya sp. PL-A3]